ncbi:MAG: diguanylate cyclase, partial [Rhodocyclaceae bacterium]|nr:diguanylate cyclase [Rhodocyclaceae bacterium]
RIELATESNGQTTWADIEYIPMRLPTGELDGFVAVTTDITERRREEARLHGLSQTDALTGLLNRAGFEQRVTSHLSSGEPEPVALMYIDLDRFKAVNDTHGHAAGDAVLRQVARRMVRRVRPTDTIARLGGDEFALFLPGLVDAAQLARIGRQIIEDLSQPIDIGDGKTATIGASAGGVAGQVDRERWAGTL